MQCNVNIIDHVSKEIITEEKGNYLASNLSYEHTQVKQTNLQYAGNEIIGGSQIR